jgi:hypothetical protein
MAIIVEQSIIDQYAKTIVVRVNGQTPAEIRRAFEQQRDDDMYWGVSGYDE